MTAPNPRVCDHPECRGVDNHPRFILYTGKLVASVDHFVSADIFHEHDNDQDGYVEYHHDCAAALGHAKAQLIVDNTAGAKGDELRALLTDPNHAVHAVVSAHSDSEVRG